MVTAANRVGSWTALIVGFPIGMAFSFGVLYLSLHSMLDLGLTLIGGKLFWHPMIWAGVIPLTFALLLWKAGDRIKIHFEQGYSEIKTSFLFSFFVNMRLFVLLLLIFIGGGLFFNTNPSITFALSASIGLTLLTLIVATIFTTFTIGFLIVTITKNKIFR
jgi:hypothetical protein